MKSAFTLIELLIVVAIIGILAAIAVPNFLQAQIRAKISRVLADHRALTTAENMYRLDNNTFHRHAHTPWQHVPLTTPVAYLAFWPIDPFQEKLPESAKAIAPYAKRTIHWEPIMGGFDLARAEGYLLQYPQYVGWNVSSGPGPGHGTYDITNGLNSDGNITTFVPGDAKADYARAFWNQ
jgi:prepilin-type N-terminal cleavage/methylation domain-containing protein